MANPPTPPGWNTLRKPPPASEPYFFETIDMPPVARENVRAIALRTSGSRSSRASDSYLAGSTSIVATSPKFVPASENTTRHRYARTTPPRSGTQRALSLAHALSDASQVRMRQSRPPRQPRSDGRMQRGDDRRRGCTSGRLQAIHRAVHPVRLSISGRRADWPSTDHSSLSGKPDPVGQFTRTLPTLTLPLSM